MGIDFFREVSHMLWVMREQINHINLELARVHTHDRVFHIYR